MNIDSNQPEDQTSGAVIMDIRHISAEQLAQLGMQQVAYVKQVMVNGAQGFAIHAADGTPMAVVEDVDTAVELVCEHGMAFAAVH